MSGLNTEQQIEVSTKAANLLGYSNINIFDDSISRFVRYGTVEAGYGTYNFGAIFDIFTNAQDLLDVVKKLLEFNITIIQSYDNKAFGYQDYTDEDDVVFVWQFDTYKEAVAAAVLGIQEGV